MSKKSYYGFYHGGDPRDFHPDCESCSKDEIDNHRKACELWDEAESRGETPTPDICESGWLHDEHGNRTVHVLRSSYGIGCGFYDDEDECIYLEEETEPT